MSGTAQIVTTPAVRRYALWQALRRPGARIGLAIVALFLLMTVAAPWIAPIRPVRPGSFQRSVTAGCGSSGSGPISTAATYSAVSCTARRTALIVIIVADGLALVAGGALGLIAGFVGGAVDAVVMRLVDVLLAFPYLLLALIIVAALGPSLTNSIIAIGIINMPQYARLMRGQVLAVQNAEYVWAARSVGATRLRVMLRHVLPNSFSPVLVMATLQAGSVVVETAGLSFLGLGAQPPSPDWGALLADGHSYFLTAWWIATFPGLAIFLVVVGFNLVGDALRDQLDPRRRT